jgi:hypothetical protein
VGPSATVLQMKLPVSPAHRGDGGLCPGTREAVTTFDTFATFRAVRSVIAYDFGARRLPVCKTDSGW